MGWIKTTQEKGNRKDKRMEKDEGYYLNKDRDGKIWDSFRKGLCFTAVNKILTSAWELFAAHLNVIVEGAVLVPVLFQ